MIASPAGFGPARASHNPLVLKLDHFGPLTPVEVTALEQLCLAVRGVDPRTTLVREGERPEAGFVVMSGFVCRYKHCHDGARQIIGYLLPGDISDIDLTVGGPATHSLCAISACTLARFTAEALAELGARHPRLARLMRRCKLAEGATTQEWLVNLGCRSAEQRLAHLLCELRTRLHAVGRAPGNRCELPMTQVDLGDTVGLSSVHVNRTLQSLRRRGLISLNGRHLHILDGEGLCAVAGFAPAYLDAGAA